MHVYLCLRYFALCAATHFPPTWMQTTFPRIRSETPFRHAAEPNPVAPPRDTNEPANTHSNATTTASTNPLPLISFPLRSEHCLSRGWHSRLATPIGPSAYPAK